jgi:hypothetical protein
MKMPIAFGVVAVGCTINAIAFAQLALPYTGSCNSNTCLKVTNTYISGTGILGQSNVGGEGVYGGTTGSSSSVNAGVLGEETNDSVNVKDRSYGVFGRAWYGTGVHGEAVGSGSLNGVEGTAVVGGSSGVYGRNSADGGIGVFGENTTSTGYAGYFNGRLYAVSELSGNNPAIWGKSIAIKYGVGVKGEANSGSTAVWGYNPGAVAGWFDGNVYATSYAATSDGRLKKDVQDLSSGIETLLKLRPVTFRWKAEEDKSNHFGLIAQEVEKVVPEIVARSHGPTSSETLTVAYMELVPILIKAVQEQNKTILEQEARIAALERAHLPAKLSSLLLNGVSGGALWGLLPVGVVLAFRRRKPARADTY